MRLTRCRYLPRRPLTGAWFRAIRPQFFQTALAFAHTATIPGRFNGGTMQRPGFPVLYLAEDQTVALFEVSALLGSPLPGQAFAPNSNQPWTGGSRERAIKTCCRSHASIPATVDRNNGPGVDRRLARLHTSQSKRSSRSSLLDEYPYPTTGSCSLRRQGAGRVPDLLGESAHTA